jgi:hypothetical protein
MKLESVRAGSGTEARNLLIKTTEREHSSSVWDLSPEEFLPGTIAASHSAFTARPCDGPRTVAF